MNLTFKGFLRSYCRELTGLQTDNLRKLCDCVNKSCPAAAEAVVVFAASQDKIAYLAGYAKGTWVGESCDVFAVKSGGCSSIELFLQSDEAPQRFKKVWLAYQAKKHASDADRRVIALMREKTLAVLSESGATIYSVCQDLRLNKGNVYAYLNKGDATKVSRSTARMILRHTQELARGSALQR